MSPEDGRAVTNDGGADKIVSYDSSTGRADRVNWRRHDDYLSRFL